MPSSPLLAYAGGSGGGLDLKWYHSVFAKDNPERYRANQAAALNAMVETEELNEDGTPLLKKRAAVYGEPSTAGLPRPASGWELGVGCWVGEGWG